MGSAFFHIRREIVYCFLPISTSTPPQCLHFLHGKAGTLGDNIYGNAEIQQDLSRLNGLFPGTFLPAFLHAIIPGVLNLVLYVSFRSHIELIFGSFVGCKISQFRRIEQEFEDFLLGFRRTGC